MLTVACVYRTFTGVQFGSAYDDTWVRRLRDGVARNLTVPHRFVCLSNTEVIGVDTIPLQHAWEGWWSKVEMFRPGLFDGPVLSMDLDVLVTGNIDAFAGPFPQMMMLSDTFPNMKNSTCMWWDARDPDYAAIYHHYASDPEGLKRFHHLFNYQSMGDQGLINDVLTAKGKPIALWQDVLGAEKFSPFSFNSQPNRAVLSGPLSPDIRLLYCLGRPKFDAFLNHPTVIQHWREGGTDQLNLI